MNRTEHVHHVVCYRKVPVSSGGIWGRSNPLSYALPLLLTQVSLIAGVSVVLHSLLRRAGQSSVVSQIAAGALVGFPYKAPLFPLDSKVLLDVLAGTGVTIFIFMIGVKTDFRSIIASGSQAATLALSSTIIPSVFMLLSGALIILSSLPTYPDHEFLFKLGYLWSATSYVVISCMLDELNLLNSKLGRLALSATLISEISAMIVNSVASHIRTLQATSFFSFLCFLGFIFLVARPATLWIIRKTPEGELIEEHHLVIVLILTVACGFFSEIIGHSAATGTFLLGLSLPGGAPLGVTLDRKLGTMVSGILIPLFMGYAGAKIDVRSILNGARFRRTLFFLLLGSIGKTVGVVLPCIYFKIPPWDTAILSLMMNSKGIYEIYMLDTFLGHEVLDEEAYSIIVIGILGFTFFINFFLKLTYNPFLGYYSCKKATIQHSRREPELRVLACIHNDDDVIPTVELLQSLHATGEKPLCAYVIHVVDFVGRTTATLTAYQKPKNPNSAATSTDHVMNVFRFFERENDSAVFVMPFVSASPPATVYEDVCALALEKKISFVVLPFHKKLAIDGTIETNAAMKTTNMKMLEYSPCSVGILIGTGVGEVLRRIAVYFLGGADDREALAFATRVAESPSAYVVAVRFRLPERLRKGSLEEELDEDAIKEFRTGAVQNSERVTYREEVIKDGKEMMATIRSLSPYCSLLVVGRKLGEESALTVGLSTLSDYPELGVLGGALASVDFGCAVSLLIVQQQREKFEEQEEEWSGGGGRVVFQGFKGRHGRAAIMSV